MCKIQNPTRRTSGGNSSKSDLNFGETSWDDAGESSLTQKISQLCNAIPLSAVFKRYGISFEDSQNYSGWQHTNCPFKDHDDSSPSFGYNVTKDSFNCFGCGRGGRSVHFISYYEDIPIIQVVKTLAQHFNDVTITPIETINYKELDALMIQHSNAMRSFIQQYVNDYDAMQQAIEYTDELNTVYDTYMASIVTRGSVDLEYLKFLQQYIVEQLERYGDNECPVDS